MADDMCSSCFKDTKYSCLSCNMPFCCECTFFENDEETRGWIMGKSVGYCQVCFEEKRKDKPEVGSSSVTEVNDEVDDELDQLSEEEKETEDPEFNSKKVVNKKPGRKSVWSAASMDDLIDIIVNNENYKRNLIFVNVKNQKNSKVYEAVLRELKRRALERDENISFNIHQIRNKFKKCIAECKKAALTIKTATGVKRFADSKGYGSWFDQLYPIVRARDSCQPEMAKEPSATIESESEEQNGTEQFVPVKSGRKRKVTAEDTNQQVLRMIKEVISNDPTKQLLDFLKDEMERQRQHEAQLFSMLSQSSMFNPGALGYHHQQPRPSFIQEMQGYPSVPFPSLPPNPQQATSMFNNYPPSTSGL